jgi:hypothetical protein
LLGFFYYFSLCYVQLNHILKFRVILRIDYEDFEVYIKQKILTIC